MHISPLFFMLAMMAVAALSGCARDAGRIAGPPKPEAVAITVDNSVTAMTILSATLADCPSGGSLIDLFKDANNNGVFDPNETLVSSTKVCNGLNGLNGANGVAGATGATGAAGAQGIAGAGAGIILATAPSASCPAGGTSITTFQDSNNNGILDALEKITSSSTVCNGIAGTVGATGATGAAGAGGVAGANGAAGVSAFITATAASSAQCPAGGIVYLTHTDGSVPQSSVICNGSNGNQAQFAMGPVGSQVKDQAYSACHHDYLYIPDQTSRERGWLIFRHQKNGSSDQGIGSTGFNVWNVDISDFYLVSEQNNEVYCQLHWEPSQQLLSYTVVSKLDGLAGEKGEIKMK